MLLHVRAFLPIAAAALVLASATGRSGAPGAVQQAFDQRYPEFEVAAWEQQQPYGEYYFDATGRRAANEHEDA